MLLNKTRSHDDGAAVTTRMNPALAPGTNAGGAVRELGSRALDFNPYPRWRREDTEL